MRIKNEIEILSPAKNKDIGIAAIDCGADALYIAGPVFGARKAAGNSVHEIEELIRYARRFGVKVYMVINTILFDSEIEEAVKLAWQAYSIGCDALIIQDMGLLMTELPPVPLFASTQTDIRTVEQAKLLEALGFSRLILARELSLDQIEKISSAVDIDIETFIHGALCVSYSGQCYMSSRVTGRSGNRGECTQLCRANYDLVDSNGMILAKNKALLSLKDLNLSGYLSELIEAGVTSFKIEGRLKSISYVKNIVRYYRLLVDRLIRDSTVYTRSSYGVVSGGFVPDPIYTFTRGYTAYNIEGRREKWCSGESAKSVGEFVGEVNEVSSDDSCNTSFFVTSKFVLANGDGLVLVSPNGTVSGVRASVVEKNGKRWKITANEILDITLYSKVYRNYNHNFERELETNMPERYIDVETILLFDSENIVLRGRCKDGREEEVSIVNRFEIARNQEEARQTISAQLGKRTDIYQFIPVGVSETELCPFLPISVVNRLRRDLAEKFRLSDPVKKPAGKPVDRAGILSVRAPEIKGGSVIDYRANVSNSLSKRMYERLYGKQVDWAFEVDPPDEVELMKCKYCIKFELGMCRKGDADKLYTGPLYIENGKKRFRIEFDCTNCEMMVKG